MRSIVFVVVVAACSSKNLISPDAHAGDATTIDGVVIDTIASPGQGSGATIGAADFGCVDSITGGFMFTGKTSHHVASLPRTLYHPIAQ